MKINVNSIRTFIGSRDFNESRSFYQALGFDEIEINDKLSHFNVDENMGFYLQDLYEKEWIENTMIFLDVVDIQECRSSLNFKKLKSMFPAVKLTEITNQTWGKEMFMHDPAGVLWIFGEFNSTT